MPTDPPNTLTLRDPLLTLPSRSRQARYSSAHYHPGVGELVPANDNDDGTGPQPPRPNWTAATISSRPNGQLATYHETRPTFTAFSRKTRRLVSEESFWERLYRVWWNLDPDIADFEMQGLKIEMVTEDGTKRTYTVDAVLAHGGRIKAREIKASGSHLLEPDTRQLMINTSDILARAGIGFTPVTGNALLENRRLLMNLSYGSIHKDDAVPADERDAVIRAITRGASRFADIEPILGECPLIRKAKAFSLLASSALWFDLREELRQQSIIRAPVAATAPDIRKIKKSFVR